MIKNRLRVRLFIVSLALIMLMNLFSIGTHAAVEGSVRVNSERFLTDEMHVSGGGIRVDSSQNAVVEFIDEEPSVTMSISNKYIPKNSNSLRIVLDNASFCETVEIEYMYKNPNDVLVTRRTEFSIMKGSGAKEYIIPIDDPYAMTSLKLTFKEGARGSITLVSIGTVSHYYDDRSYCGDLTRSEYDPSTRKAHIAGTVSWETVSRNNGEKIVVYSLKPGECAEDIKSPESYIESRDISLNFDITIEGVKTLESYYQYFVAVLTQSGEIMPIAPEFYLNSKTTDESEWGEVGFKGMDTSLYGGAIDGGSSLVFVDVYLNRLFSYDESGFQYIVDGMEYYVDKNYIAELDAAIGAYRTAGIDVYLRFLVESDGYGKLFWKIDPSTKAKYYSSDIFDETVFDKFIVYSEYVIARYSNDNIGRVRGVVIGRSLDLSNIYNYSGVDNSTVKYAEKIAKTASAIKTMLDKHGIGREVILPFSDSSCANDLPILDVIEGRTYPISILASSVVKYIESYNVNIEGLYFMLEADSAPIAEEKGESGAAAGGASERTAAGTSVYAPISQCLEFENMLALLCEEHRALSDRFMYCWFVSDESPSNNYVYNYNVAASVDSIRSFVVSLAEAADDEKNVLSELKNTYKLADTEKNADISGEVIKSLGFGSWKEIIEDFNSKNMIKRSFIQKTLTNSVPSAIKGSYKMWNFGGSEGASGWDAIYGCKNISIHPASEDMSRALMFAISNDGREQIGSEYGSAIYSQQSLLKVSGISGLSFDVAVPKSAQEKIYEILITVESAEESVEFSGVVFSGSETMLYADIESIDTVKAIRFSVRELSSSKDGSYTIYLKSIAIHSDKYSSSELEKMVLSGNLTDDNGGSDDTLGRRAMIVTAVIILVSIVLVWAAWLIFSAIQRN